MSRNTLFAVAAIVAAALTACGDGDNLPTDPEAENPQTFLDCEAVEVIGLGTVNGLLTSTDCRFNDDSFIDYYELRITSGRTFTITLNSAEFDAWLWVFDRSTGEPIAADDDSGGGANARLQIQLVAGTYILGANSFDPEELGSYQLSVN